jgi:hypothetical protein
MIVKMNCKEIINLSLVKSSKLIRTSSVVYRWFNSLVLEFTSCTDDSVTELLMRGKKINPVSEIKKKT